MNKNNEVEKIIKFIKEIKNKSNNIKESIIFNSQSVCNNKILILTKTSKDKIYKYINEAIKKNIRGVVLCNRIEKKMIHKNIPILYTQLVSSNLNFFLEKIYDYPLKDKIVVGVTGTDGKTSTVNFLAQALSNKILDKKVGIISSLGNGIYPKLSSTKYTTPRSDLLYRYFSIFKKNNVDIVIIECSSHALSQGRLNNIDFDYSIYTNITSDHLDYHKTIDRYVKSKLKLMNKTKKTIYINKNCQTLKEIKINKNLEIIKYNLTEKKRENLKTILAPIDLISLFLKRVFDINKNIINKILLQLKPIKGRFTYISKSNKKIIIDSAHTPASLESIMKNIVSTSEYKKESFKIITVFGCGGERDKSKRKIMGHVASKYSDVIYLTNDNPRHENPLFIIKEISDGISSNVKCSIIPDRKKAIKEALSHSNRNHLVLITGKGDEKYIEQKSKKIPHNDIKYVKMLLR